MSIGVALISLKEHVVDARMGAGMRRGASVYDGVVGGSPMRRSTLTTAVFLHVCASLLALGGFLWLADEHGLGRQTGIEFRELLPEFGIFAAGAMLLLLTGIVLLGDVARNQALDRPRKWLWAAIGTSTPPSLLAYWWVHVRPFRSDEEMTRARAEATPAPVSTNRLGSLLSSRRHKLALAAAGFLLIAVVLITGFPVPLSLLVLVIAALALRLAQFPASDQDTGGPPTSIGQGHGPSTPVAPTDPGTSPTVNRALVIWFAVLVPLFMIAFVVALLISET
jgi:hypothetical protein